MIKGRKQCLSALTIVGGSFVILMILVWNNETNTIDMAVRSWALGLNTPTTVAIWERISFMGSIAVLSGLTFLALGIFALRREWQAVRQIGLSMAGAVGFETVTKWLVHRPRPEEVYARTLPSSYSFPSGHALFSFTFYLVIAVIICRQNRNYIGKGVWIAALFMVVLIGASRIFLGVHYFSDVLGGYLIAAFWLMFSIHYGGWKPQGV